MLDTEKGGTLDSERPVSIGRSSVRRPTEEGTRSHSLDSRAAAISDLAPSWAQLAEVSDQLPSHYRESAFTEFVRFTLDGLRSSSAPARSDHVAGMNTRAVLHSVAQPALETEAHADRILPLQKVEAVLGVSDGSLSRVLQIGADGSVQVLARVEGRSMRDSQVRLSQIVCFVREKGLGEMKTDMEMLRTICQAHGVYDSANFTANFRREGSLRETTAAGTRERMYILSPEGVEAAAALLRQLANT